jgi:two-component system sensor histidine kinase UhpB
LENLVQDWQRRHSSVALTMNHDLPPDLSPSVTLVVYRVVQESVINALRHARATRVHVEVGGNAQRLLVTVTDDGIGLPEDWSKPGHFGLRGLKDRVSQLGGSLDIRNQPAGGVQLTADIPAAAIA